MNKLILIISTVLILNTCLYSDEPDINLHLKCLYPTVRVYSEKGMGSGTIIYSDLIGLGEYLNVALTCGHVLDDGNKSVVLVPKYKDWSTFSSYEAYKSRTYYIDYDKDLALVVFKSKTRMPISKINLKEKLYIDSKVLSFGFGDGIEGRLDRGEITSVNIPKMLNGADVYRSNLYVITGDSGSSVFHNYEIIGVKFALVLQGGEKQLNHDSLIVPIKYLKLMSEENNNNLDFIWDKSNQDFPCVELDMLDLPEMVDSGVEQSVQNYNSSEYPPAP